MRDYTYKYGEETLLYTKYATESMYLCGNTQCMYNGQTKLLSLLASCFRWGSMRYRVWERDKAAITFQPTVASGTIRLPNISGTKLDYQNSNPMLKAEKAYSLAKVTQKTPCSLWGREGGRQPTISSYGPRFV